MSTQKTSQWHPVDCGCPQCVYHRAYVDPPAARHPELPCSVCGRTWDQHQGHTCRRPRTHHGWAVAGTTLGSVWAIISAIVWAYTAANANTCKNALVGALDQSQCTSVTFWHDISGFSVLLAILVIILAGLAMYGGRRQA